MGSPSLRWRRREAPAPRAPPPPQHVRATRQAAITSYLERGTRPAPSVPTGRAVVVSLFDSDGMALAPWAARGYECIAYTHSDKPREWGERTVSGIRMVTTLLTPVQIYQIGVDLAVSGVAFACASPPSKDLSVAGARHWKQKRIKNPEFQENAVELVRNIDAVFKSWGCPYYISNSATSQLRKLWRLPNHTYQPHHFGKYLEPTERHPLYPDIVPNQDAYTQRQGLWTVCGPGARSACPTLSRWLPHGGTSQPRPSRMSGGACLPFCSGARAALEGPRPEGSHTPFVRGC